MNLPQLIGIAVAVGSALVGGSLGDRGIPGLCLSGHAQINNVRHQARATLAIASSSPLTKPASRFS